MGNAIIFIRTSMKVVGSLPRRNVYNSAGSSAEFCRKGARDYTELIDRVCWDLNRHGRIKGIAIGDSIQQNGGGTGALAINGNSGSASAWIGIGHISECFYKIIRIAADSRQASNIL